MNKVLKYILFLAIFATSIFALETKVLIVTKKSELNLGDSLTLGLTAVAKKDSKVVFPKIDEIGGFKVLKKASIVKELKENYKAQTIFYTLKPTKSFILNPITIKIDNKEYKTKKIAFKVKNDNKQKETEVNKSVKNNKLNSVKNSNNIKNEISKKNYKKKNGNIFIFKMKSNKKEVFVGEPFVLTITLIEPIDIEIANIEYNPPISKNFKFINLGGGKTYEKEDKLVRVINYAVVAKKSGNLKIEPATARIGVQLAPQAVAFGMFGPEIHWKNLKTNSLVIDVKDIPQNIELIGDYKISAKVNTNKVKENKPIKYKLIIEGAGLLENIKDYKFHIKNVTVYDDKAPTIKHEFKNGEIFSRYEKEYTFVARKDFDIPKVIFKAFNPKNKKIYNLAMDSLHIKVKKNKTITSILNNQNNLDFSGVEDIIAETNIKAISQNKNIDEKAIAKIEDILFDKEYYKRLYSNKKDSANPLLTFILGLIIGILATFYIPKFFLLIKQRNKQKPYGSYEEALNILYPHITDSDEIEDMVKMLYEVINGNKEIKINESKLEKMVKKYK
jgi:hypothetical protein